MIHSLVFCPEGLCGCTIGASAIYDELAVNDIRLEDVG